MRAAALAFASFMFVSVSGLSAAETWTGQISDSHCGAKHMAMGGKQMSDRECTQTCVKGGAKYVFVVDGKVYQLANQTDPALATHAGHTVLLTGDLKGDTITVTKVEMPKTDKR